MAEQRVAELRAEVWRGDGGIGGAEGSSHLAEGWRSTTLAEQKGGGAPEPSRTPAEQRSGRAEGWRSRTLAEQKSGGAEGWIRTLAGLRQAGGRVTTEEARGIQSEGKGSYSELRLARES